MISARAVVAALVVYTALAAQAAPANVGRWETRAPMLSERTEVAGAALASRIYVVGGFVPGGVTGALEEYDVAANTWRQRAPLPVAVPQGGQPSNAVAAGAAVVGVIAGGALLLRRRHGPAKLPP